MKLKRILKGKFKLILVLLATIASIASVIGIKSCTHTPFKQTVIGIIINSDNSQYSLDLITAITYKERAEGLMFTTRLGRSEGMTFIYESESFYNFWMYNTFIPLDIIFLDNNNKVVHIYPNAIPHQTKPYITTPNKAKYVLELNAGSVDLFKINLNTYIYF
jgi:uncharacterized membrane protein (UPF0127 family)